MPEPINLTQLRADAQAYIDRQDLWDNADNAQAYVDAHELLALIDIAQAAHKAVASAEGDPNASTVTINGELFDRLCDALARTTP